MKHLIKYALFLLPTFTFAIDNHKNTCDDIKPLNICIIEKEECKNGSIKSDSIYCTDNIEDISDSIIQIEQIIQTKKSIHKVVSTQKKHHSISKTKQLNIWDALQSAFDFFSGLWKKNNGYFKPNPRNSSGPYTVFNEDLPGYDKNYQLNEIRRKIIANEDGFLDMYKQIFTQAAGIDESFCTERTGVCVVARSAKCAAFVYLVGIDVKTTHKVGHLDQDSIYATSLSSSDRSAYMQKLINHGYEMPGRAYVDLAEFTSSVALILAIGTFNPLIYLAGQAGEYGLFYVNFKAMYYRSFELTMLLSAYDMVKWSGHFSGYSNGGITIDQLPNMQTGDDIDKMATNIKDDYVVPFYKSARNSTFLYSNNNYGLLAGGALLMAACVLNDNGGYCIQFDRWPSRWASAGLYNIQNNMWDAWGGSLSQKGGTYGYSEGSHYYARAFSVLIPAFRTFQNFYPSDGPDAYYNYPPWLFELPNPIPKLVKNPNFDSNYDNLYKWHLSLIQPDGNQPTFDESYHTSPHFNGGLAIRGKGIGGTQYNIVKSNDPVILGVLDDVGKYDLIPDYLVAAVLTPPDTNGYLNLESVSLDDGNTVLRNNTSDGSKHYLLGMAEHGTALNSFYHENYEPGHFTICADKDILIMDRPTYNETSSDDVGRFRQHNVIYHGDAADITYWDNYNTATYDLITVAGYSEFKLYLNSLTTHTFSPNQTIKDYRTFRSFSGDNYFYYIIDDRTNSTTDYHSLRINGNGQGSTFVGNGAKSTWKYPCTLPDSIQHWGVISETSASPASVTFSSDDQLHGANNVGKNDQGITFDQLVSSSSDHGTHSTFYANISDNQYARYLTKITPYKCGVTNIQQDAILVNNDSYNTQMVKIYNSDTIHNFHFARHPYYQSTLSFTDPLNLGNSDILNVDAISAFFSYSKNNNYKTGSCTSFTHFRAASISIGDTLKYADTIYISSNLSISAYYQITGKYTYSGYVSADTSTIVTFCIPDLDARVPMVAWQGYGTTLTSTYNDSVDWKHITITFPVGITKFTIEPANPCMFDCYFPPLSVNINDTTFNADDKGLHHLGHKLTILNHGLLNVTKGTRIDMCDGVYLRNRDSLIIEGPCQTSNKFFDPCSGIDGITNTDKSSAIIVSAGSALVLDSGSYTYLKSGGAIWVKQNGSLIIKNNAFVQIGDSANRSCNTGFGEIITEPGANLYIEPNAHIEFARIAGDTVDRNMFYAKGASASVYPFMSTILTTDTILNALDYPVAICALDTINPVTHREWGYCDFMHPLATYQVHNGKDTICPGEQLCIDLNRILNSASTSINVCRKSDIHKDSFWFAASIPPYDHYRITDTIPPHYFHYLDTCIQDTFWRDSVIRYGDDSCLKLHTIPDHMCFHFNPNTLHRITINTINDCGVRHDTVGYVFVADTPKFSIWIPDSVCSGTILTTYVTDINHKPGTYTFGISEIPDSLMFADIIANPADSVLLGHYFETHSGYLPDSFTFSNFRVKGNRTYAVSLSLFNDCGSASTYHLTKTTFGAKINITLASTYNNPIGPAAFQLHGIASGATSFSWSPTTYLTNPTTLDPISTPPDSIRYVFTASNGTCTDRDTAYVRHNELAYAGIDTEVCYNQNILLGTDYNAAIFLGLIWHSANHGMYDNIYNTIQSGNANFAKVFMHWMVLHLGDYGGQPAIDNFRNNEDLRSAIFKDQNFITYYNNFISNNASSTTFNDFDNMLNANSTLQNLVENTYQYMPGSNFLDFNFAQNLFQDYTNWYNANNDPLSIKWERLDSTTWTPLYGYYEFFNMVPDNTRDKYYRITVINNSNSSVEFDKVLVKRDSIVSPQFEIAYRYDSTVIFRDVSIPEQHMYSYSWNFGDGGYSTIKNPYHTFAHSDTTFIVCMTIRDSCGTYTKCDTLKIDSAYKMVLYGKTGQTKSTKHDDQTTNSQTPNDNYLSVNKPNPFSDYSIAEYVLSDGIHDAEIRITTTIGQIVKSYKLQNNKGIIIIDGSQLRDGMYYYSLIVDGAVVASKVMVVQK